MKMWIGFLCVVCAIVFFVIGKRGFEPADRPTLSEVRHRLDMNRYLTPDTRKISYYASQGITWPEVPNECRTPEIWALGVETQTVDSALVPDSIKGPEYYKTLVGLWPEWIKIIPEKYMDREMVLTGFKLGSSTAVFRSLNSDDFRWLSLVPASAWNHELAKDVAFYGGLEFIPDSLIDSTVVANALMPNSRLKEYFRFIPDHEKGRELCKEAVVANPANIKFVPESILDHNMVFAMVVRTPSLLSAGIPEKFLTRKLYLEVVRANGAALQYVPWEKRDRQMCLAALKNGNGAWEFVPKKLFFDDKFISSAMASR